MFIKQHGIDAVRLWLDERRVRFDAVVAANDGMASGVLEELQRRNIRVPEDVALFGFDDRNSRDISGPAYHRQAARSGARAKSVRDNLGSNEGPEVHRVTTVKSQLVLRRSADALLQ